MAISVCELVRQNEAKLEKLILWLQHDAAARTVQRSYGFQEIRVDWQDGRIELTTIFQKHSFKDEMPAPGTDSVAVSVDSRNGRL